MVAFVATQKALNTSRYVTLHFRGQRRASSLYYRNRPEITVLVCAKKSAFPCMVIELSEVRVSDGHNYDFW